MSNEPLSATGAAYVIDGLKLEYPYLRMPPKNATNRQAADSPPAAPQIYPL